jgi:membrane fusion protein (multidrug efflux system)
VVGPDDKVVPHKLVTSGMRGTDWIVDSGLQPGDRVIVQGTEKVHPGMTVKAVPAQLADAGNDASAASSNETSLGASPEGTSSGASAPHASSGT